MSESLLKARGEVHHPLTDLAGKVNIPHVHSQSMTNWHENNSMEAATEQR